MIVRCMANEGNAIPDSCLFPTAGLRPDTVVPLTIGSDYIVYALTVFRGHTWYYVFDDNKQPYPVWRLAEFFDIVEPSMPECWIVNYVRTTPGKEGHSMLSFPEWALDRFFYERLVDEDPEAVAVFATRRREIEQSGRP